MPGRESNKFLAKVGRKAILGSMARLIQSLRNAAILLDVAITPSGS
jgi:hypothetical protein